LVFDDEDLIDECLVDVNHLSPYSASSYHSSSSYVSDSSMEPSPFIGPNKIRKPRIQLVYSPNGSPSNSPSNRAIFIEFIEDKYISNGQQVPFNEDDFAIVASPTPEPDKFTFTNIDREYKPHRIRWTNDTSNGYSGDEMGSYSQDSEQSESSSSEHRRNEHDRDRSRTIDALLSNLYASDDSLSESVEEIDNKYKIVINRAANTQRTRYDPNEHRNFLADAPSSNSNSDYSSGDSSTVEIMDDSEPSTPPLGDDDDDDSVLFDVGSFAQSMSLKRNAYL